MVSQASSKRNPPISDSDIHYCRSDWTPAKVLCPTAIIRHQATIAHAEDRHQSSGSTTNSGLGRAFLSSGCSAFAVSSSPRVSEIVESPLAGPVDRQTASLPAGRSAVAGVVWSTPAATAKRNHARIVYTEHTVVSNQELLRLAQDFSLVVCCCRIFVLWLLVVCQKVMFLLFYYFENAERPVKWLKIIRKRWTLGRGDGCWMNDGLNVSWSQKPSTGWICC